MKFDPSRVTRARSGEVAVCRETVSYFGSFVSSVCSPLSSLLSRTSTSLAYRPGLGGVGSSIVCGSVLLAVPRSGAERHGARNGPALGIEIEIRPLHGTNRNGPWKSLGNIESGFRLAPIFAMAARSRTSSSFETFKTVCIAEELSSASKRYRPVGPCLYARCERKCDLIDHRASNYFSIGRIISVAIPHPPRYAPDRSSLFD